VGACAAGVPLYVSEISPASIRGSIIGLEQMILCFGELIAFWLNYGFIQMSSPDWWRIPLAIQIVPAAILGIGCWFWIPPSPRWLVEAEDREECALEILTRLHGSRVARIELAEIKASVKAERRLRKPKWIDMFKPPVLRVTLLGMGVQVCQQVTGTGSLLYYTVRLFKPILLTSHCISSLPKSFHKQLTAF
jgi:MFS family permease